MSKISNNKLILKTQCRNFTKFWLVRKYFRNGFHSEYFYRPQRSCGQGYVFTRVCDSVHRGGLRQREPPLPLVRSSLPGREHTPSGQGEPLPWQGGPPRAGRHPPGREIPSAYGQWAAGTHPAGMHSCLSKFGQKFLIQYLEYGINDGRSL